MANSFEPRSNRNFTPGLERTFTTVFIAPARMLKKFCIAPVVRVISANLIIETIKLASAGPPAFKEVRRDPNDVEPSLNVFQNFPTFGSAPAFRISFM